MFLEPSWLGPMEFKSMTIDLASGHYGHQPTVDFHTGGETTRTWMFHRATGHFLLPQANFTQNVSVPPQREIHLFDVDPTTGAITKKLVTGGAYNLVTGFRYVESIDKIVMATWNYNSTGAQTGYDFFHLDPRTAVATKINSIENQAVDNYAGWFHEASEDGKTLYRLGYEDVIRDQGFGVQTTDLNGATATSSFKIVPDPENYGHYKSINKLPDQPNKVGSTNGPLFVSVAPSYNESNFADLGLFIWNLGNTSQPPRKVTSFPNAHRSPYFGPINEVLSPDRTRYAAMVAQASILGRSYYTWGIGLVDLVTGNTTEVQLSPEQLASTSSVSGFGIPKNSSAWTRNIVKSSRQQKRTRFF